MKQNVAKLTVSFQSPKTLELKKKEETLLDNVSCKKKTIKFYFAMKICCKTYHNYQNLLFQLNLQKKRNVR
jgi:hypothetical protein